MRPESPKTRRCASSSCDHVRDNPLLSAIGFQKSHISSRRVDRSNFSVSSSKPSASSLDRSTTSLVTRLRFSALDLAISMSATCLASGVESARSCNAPRTPFNGVRISWLMIARNRDLVRLASSDCSTTFLRVARNCVTSKASLLCSSFRRSPIECEETECGESGFFNLAFSVEGCAALLYV